MTNNFTAFAGDTLLLRIAITGEVGEPLALSGYSAAYYIAKCTGTTAVLEKTTSNGGINLMADGIVEVSINDGDTDELVGVYYHELRLILSGEESTVLSGHAVFEERLVP